jgi:glycosyltransferase involved in cell wall biosynthesis
MKICYFGDYDPEYNRTKTLIVGLERAGASVVHCNVRGCSGFALYRALYQKHRSLRGSYDVLFVGFGNARLLPVLARLITWKPVVWEPLFSLYDNWVYDRKYVRPYSLKAYLLWAKDFLSAHAVGLVVLDVDTHAKFFARMFLLPSRKVDYVLVGADTSVFYPRPRSAKSANFEVEFHGKYIPLHGTEVLIRAAKILEDKHVHFTLIGDGQDAKKIKALASDLGVRNVTFLPFMPEREITAYIKEADLTTGILGDVPRVMRSIPNKMYQAAAMARVTVNVDSSSLREVFTPGVDAVAVPPGDPEALAGAILSLKESGRSAEMGEAAYRTFLRTATPELIGARLIDVLRRRFPGLRSVR